MMSVGEEDVQRWFDVVLQWGSVDTSEKCRDTFECLDELQVFLKQLENALGGLVGINPAETQLALRNELAPLTLIRLWITEIRA